MSTISPAEPQPFAPRPASESIGTIQPAHVAVVGTPRMPRRHAIAVVVAPILPLTAIAVFGIQYMVAGTP